MQPQRRPNSGRSLESLESRLRALPPPPVPGHLEARLLAAVPAEPSNAMPRWERDVRTRRLAVWAGTAVAVAAACLLAVRLWPGLDWKVTVPSSVRNPEKWQTPHQVTRQPSGESLNITSWIKAQPDLDGTARPPFTWPIQEKSPLMVLTSRRPDLLD
jgi:hypothetical protein